MLSRLLNLVDLPYPHYLLYRFMPLKWTCRIVRLEARLIHRFSHDVRSKITHNLFKLFGNTKDRDEIEGLTFRYFELKQLRMMLLYLHTHLKPAQKEKLFPIEGLEHLDHALAEGKGAVLVGSHLNSIMIFVAMDMLRERGYDVHMAIPTKKMPIPPTMFHKWVDRFFSNGHSEYPPGAFYAQFNIRPIVNILEKKGIVVLMGDGSHSAGFVEVDFLGRRAPFTTGAMGISRMTEAPAVPIMITGSPPDGIRINIEEPIPLEKTDDMPRDLRAMVEKYTERLEHHLLQNIACWQQWPSEDGLATMEEAHGKSLSDRYHY